jgi:hypothetical protein
MVRVGLMTPLGPVMLVLLLLFMMMMGQQLLSLLSLLQHPSPKHLDYSQNPLVCPPPE